MTPPARAGAPLAAAALVFNAFVWGVSWWPFRALQEAGVHPLWSTALVYAFALACLLAVRPRAWRGVLKHPGLWLLALATGLSNVAFNWGITIGDVVRVVLLFYLMPAWALLLAWWLLGEKPTRAALLRLLLAFAGVLLVLAPGGDSLSAAQGFSLADGLALLGGFAFALTNVTLKKLEAAPGDARMLAMFAGGAGLAGATAALGMAQGQLAGLPALAPGWGAVAAGLALAFLAGNYALQYGAARLPVGTTALIMLTEVVFASASSVALGAATLELRTVIGGVLILLASVLAALQPRV